MSQFVFVRVGVVGGDGRRSDWPESETATGLFPSLHHPLRSSWRLRETTALWRAASIVSRAGWNIAGESVVRGVLRSSAPSHASPRSGEPWRAASSLPSASTSATRLPAPPISGHSPSTALVHLQASFARKLPSSAPSLRRERVSTSLVVWSSSGSHRTVLSAR
jgi:hypothetical protein